MPSDFCCAVGCSEFRGKKSAENDNEEISFHRFPISDKNMFKKWRLAIRRDNWEPSKTSKLCSKHFTTDCFKTSGWSSRKSLKKDAIPSIFNFSNVFQNKGRNSIKHKKQMKVRLNDTSYLQRELLHRNTSSVRMDSSFTLLPCQSKEYENINTENEEMNEEYLDDIIVEPSCEEIEINDDQQESEYLQEHWSYEESNLCRFCTKPVDKDCTNVFSDNEQSVKIQEIISVVLPGQVHEEDGLPHHICIVCMAKWKECYKTVLAFFEAESYFRNQGMPDVTSDDQPVSSNYEAEPSEMISEPDQKSEPCIQSNGFSVQNWQSIIKIKSDSLEELESDNLEELECDNLEETELKDDSNGNSEDCKQCDFCFIKFSSLNDLELHKEVEHTSKKMNQIFCCVKCSVVFNKRKSLLLHIKSNHSEQTIDFPCEDCSRVFNFKHLLIQHRKLKHKKHICKECGEAFYYIKTLDRHMSLHNNSTKCSVCKKEFKNAYWRTVHEKSHTVDNNHLCWICGKMFQIKSSLDIHLQSHDRLKLNPYKCKICDKEYFSVSGINKHKVSHKERIRRFKCSKCDKDFFTNESLKQHFSSHSSTKPFVCHCGVAFKRRSNLYSHKMRHLLGQNSNKPKQCLEINKDTEVYTCSLCGKEVISKLKFKYHLGRHTGNKKPFDCEVCGALFGNLTNYKNHINIHSADLPLVCETCGIGFRTGRMLKQHKLTHEEERPYACPSCPVSFKRLYSLQEHKIVHSGLRPYECRLCSKAFARRSDCRKHVKRSHEMPVQQVDSHIHNAVNGKSNNECDSLDTIEEQVVKVNDENDNSVLK